MFAMPDPSPARRPLLGGQRDGARWLKLVVHTGTAVG